MGEGTEVRLWLPRARDLPTGDRVPELPRIVPQGIRVLFVEDDVLVSEVVSSALRGLGFEVVTCGSADEALWQLRSGVGCDVVFSDVMMPGKLNGRQLVAELQEQWPGLSVLLSSGYSDPVEGSDAARVVRVLRKPYSVPKLVDALLTAVSREPTDTAAAVAAL